MKRKGFLAALLGLAAAPALAKVVPADSPRWPGQCPNCVWLGRWQGDDDLYDLWACRSRGSWILHLAARYGPEGDVITWSIRAPMDCCYSPPIAEAYRRAVARGMLAKVERRGRVAAEAAHGLLSGAAGPAVQAADN